MLGYKSMLQLEWAARSRSACQDEVARPVVLNVWSACGSGKATIYVFLLLLKSEEQRQT